VRNYSRLRCAFGTKRSMRMKYYVEHNAADISADLWQWASSISDSVAAGTKTAAMSGGGI